jgi:RecB family exonuclease
MEQKQPVTFGGITVNVKLDRLDKLADGSYAVIDYKTGDCKVRAWLGARPDEPQLPMYALGGGHDVSAVAFARLKAGELGFVGVSARRACCPKLEDHRTTAAAARSATATGTPPRGMAPRARATAAASRGRCARRSARRDACKFCDQPMLCRIARRRRSAPAGRGAADE